MNFSDGFLEQWNWVSKFSNQKKWEFLASNIWTSPTDERFNIKISIYSYSISPLFIHNSGNKKLPTNCDIYRSFFFLMSFPSEFVREIFSGFSRRARLWREFWWIAPLQICWWGDFVSCDKQAGEFMQFFCFFFKKATLNTVVLYFGGVEQIFWPNGLWNFQSILHQEAAFGEFSLGWRLWRDPFWCSWDWRNSATRCRKCFGRNRYLGIEVVVSKIF